MSLSSRSLGSGRWTKRKWSRRSQLQDAASTALRRALLSERARSWTKVVEYYTELLDILNQVEVYQISDPDVSLAQLLYESHFHLAVALQNLNLHRKAIQQLENAAAIASIPKNGCNVGCKYETFFHTPIFSRMAYSHAACGQMKEAIKDANKAISLDNLNPDVYCVRALVWNSCKETKRAIYDLNCGLRLNPSHICTLILRGAITKSIANENEQCDENKDHEKVCKICPTNKRFLDVTDFSSPKMADFYDKFLWSLDVPHTITVVKLSERQTSSLSITSSDLDSEEQW
ncbi:uncharacterized protein LOC102481111 isoform X2 [Tupaia chinensis]|uniref:uncharacterized protein LOC102481111 isoform X2 n=1 Tax=Tupaia chinensis TaxID=246437 RepID=UPI0003C8F896|nr:uncharacterized protein LOC102481111 isoform X2 [Tupaia chinensis]